MQATDISVVRISGMNLSMLLSCQTNITCGTADDDGGVVLPSRSRLLNGHMVSRPRRSEGSRAISGQPPPPQRSRRPLGVVSDERRLRTATVANPIGQLALPTCPAPRVCINGRTHRRRTSERVCFIFFDDNKINN